MPTCMKRGGYSSLYSARIRSPSFPVKSCGVRMKNMSPPPEACLSCSRIYANRQHLHLYPGHSIQHKVNALNESSTLAFFLMCFRSGWTAWGPGWAKAPNEYFFRGGRWNWRSFMGPMWVGKKGCRSSSAGMECCYKGRKGIQYISILHSIFTLHISWPSGYFIDSKSMQLIQKVSIYLQFTWIMLPPKVPLRPCCFG